MLYSLVLTSLCYSALSGYFLALRVLILILFLSCFLIPEIVDLLNSIYVISGHYSFDD